MTEKDLINIAEKFNSFLDNLSNEMGIDKDILQEIIKSFLVG